MTQPLLSLPELKEAVAKLAGREVQAVQTRNGTYACEYIDFNLPTAQHLMGDTEELAYQNLLKYLQSKETHNGKTNRPGAGTP